MQVNSHAGRTMHFHWILFCIAVFCLQLYAARQAVTPAGKVATPNSLISEFGDAGLNSDLFEDLVERGVDVDALLSSENINAAVFHKAVRLFGDVDKISSWKLEIEQHLANCDAKDTIMTLAEKLFKLDGLHDRYPYYATVLSLLFRGGQDYLSFADFSEGVEQKLGNRLFNSYFMISNPAFNGFSESDYLLEHLQNTEDPAIQRARKYLAGIARLHPSLSQDLHTAALIKDIKLLNSEDFFKDVERRNYSKSKSEALNAYVYENYRMAHDEWKRSISITPWDPKIKRDAVELFLQYIYVFLLPGRLNKILVPISTRQLENWHREYIKFTSAIPPTSKTSVRYPFLQMKNCFSNELSIPAHHYAIAYLHSSVFLDRRLLPTNEINSAIVYLEELQILSKHEVGQTIPCTINNPSSAIKWAHTRRY